VLAGFARWLHHSRPTGLVTADELAAILRAIWGEMHPELDEDAIRDAVTRFILVLRSPDGPVTELMPGRYGFATSILQAFFAANYLVNSFRRAPKRIRERLHDPHWESVIQIAIGLVALRSREDASDLIEGAILARGRLAAEYDFSPSLYEPILHRDLFFAARLLARGIEPHPNLSNQIVSRLMQLWLLGDRDHLGRFTLLFDNARRHLVALQDLAASNRALQIALESLLSLDEHEAAFSADAATFWPIHISEKLNSLVAKGREEGVSVLVKRAVAAALGVIGQLTHPAYVLLMQYARDTNTEIRDSGQASLRKASPIPDESVKMWVDLLHDGHAANRRIALKILDQMGSLPGMVIGEMTSLLNDPDPDIRQGASRVLASVEDLPDSALLALCRAIDDADPRVQEAAIRALARPVYLPDEVIAQLIRWSRHPNIAIRRASVEALSISLNSAPPVLEALIERLKDVSDSITEYVIEPLAEKGKGEERVIASMMAIIGHLRYQIRRALARGLRHFPDQMEDKRQALLVLMSDREVIVRETVLDTVAEMTAPGHELLDYVISLVTLQQQGIASHAVQALSALRGLPVEGQLALVNALNVHWKAHGEAIAHCLSEHRPLDMEVIDRLMDLAVLRGVGQAGRGESGSLRALALRILSSAQDERPEIGLLLQQAVSEIGNGDVQIAAIQGLARTRLMTPTIRASLMNVLQEGASTDVRCEAGIALGQLIHRLPDIPFTYSELLVLLDQIAGLLDELPRRASWEHHNRYQNLLMIALNWIAARTKDLPMRLPG
jgi:hypothetical protein